MQHTPYANPARLTSAMFGKPPSNIDWLADFSCFGMYQSGDSINAKLPELLLSVAPCPNVERVTLRLNIMRDVQCGNTLSPQIGWAYLIPFFKRKRDLQSQRSDLIPQPNRIIFDDVLYHKQSHNLHYNDNKNANNSVKTPGITVQTTAPPSQNLEDDSGDTVGDIGKYTYVQVIASSLLPNCATLYFRSTKFYYTIHCRNNTIPLSQSTATQPIQHFTKKLRHPRSYASRSPKNTQHGSGFADPTALRRRSGASFHSEGRSQCVKPRRRLPSSTGYPYTPSGSP